jgi:hypothetical protein
MKEKKYTLAWSNRFFPNPKLVGLVNGAVSLWHFTMLVTGLQLWLPLIFLVINGGITIACLKVVGKEIDT